MTLSKNYLNNLSNNLIEFESYIPSFSGAIGKTFKNVEKKFNVKIDHYHNSAAGVGAQKLPKKDIIVRCGMSLNILGLQRSINKLCEEYSLP